MTVVGKGDTPFSITERKDAVRFVAHVLSTVPKNALAGARFRFEADRLSRCKSATSPRRSSTRRSRCAFIA
ncbi:Isoflavone reductase P3 [Phytophthora cinnamomi]|uniref:Isoflavone reductase P3 n=1 Tax=Phytophthora cinnamomi TaxID=4785 RepID=UPI0035596B7D|nr:Isoflavone reductase P3 [Phytophthora cinnamomi]